MRIGIDIDDTLTDVKNELIKAGENYARSLEKDIKVDKNFEDKNNNGNKWQEMFQFDYDELKYFLKDIQESITNKAKPRENVVEVINKLKNDGNKIIIITARDSEFHDDPYKYSKDWLDKNNIYYDKLVVNARNKEDTCIEEKIDLFIDDSESNCLNVKKVGIKTIRVCNKIEENNSNLICFNNWNDIYSYIQTIKIIKKEG